MKYMIYGNNRVARDFMYIFRDLEIVGMADEAESIFTDARHDRIIICDFDKSHKEKELQKMGLAYGVDYVYEEDFFASLDGMSIPSGRKIVVWGTGGMCSSLLGYSLPWDIEAFIDSYKRSDSFKGRPVFLPDEISLWEEYFVIIAVAEDREIREALIGHGLVENEDFVGYRAVLGMPSVLLRQTIFDQSYYSLECHTMQNHLEILLGGETRNCCPTFVSQGLANIFDMGIGELWGSVLHRVLCLSTENRTFTFCDKGICPLFVAKEKKSASEAPIGDMPYREMPPFPETLALGYDSSCNLSCATCRKEVHFAEGEELGMVRRITDKVVNEYLPKCKFLILAGNGEVFASPAYREVYRSPSCRPQYIRLLSNGTLFTPGNWGRLIEGKDAKMMLTVSVDAATGDTYRRIRGGDFDALRKNMEFAARLRKDGGLCYFRMNFVVQRENYEEMVPFVEWGQRLGVDEVFFTKILNWGTYTEEEFAEVSMMEPDGVTPKPELRAVMGHPVMQSGIVDMGTIRFAHKVDEVGVVENYYMWELEKRGGGIFS